jgi:dipeptide/tripeptide permease
MKSVVQAAWLMTIAFGNVIVIIVAEAKAKSFDQVQLTKFRVHKQLILYMFSMCDVTRIFFVP